MLQEATLTLKHLKAKEAIEQATLNYQTEVLRDALVGGVSHELRTPLATILGTCERAQSVQQSRATVNRANWSRRSTRQAVSSTTKSAICSMPRGSAPKAFVRS
jgi:K+-sensing histidine kinase KdpD